MHQHTQSNGLACVTMNSSTSSRGHSHHFLFLFFFSVSYLFSFTACLCCTIMTKSPLALTSELTVTRIINGTSIPTAVLTRRSSFRSAMGPQTRCCCLQADYESKHALRWLLVTRRCSPLRSGMLSGFHVKRVYKHKTGSQLKQNLLNYAHNKKGQRNRCQCKKSKKPNDARPSLCSLSPLPLRSELANQVSFQHVKQTTANAMAKDAKYRTKGLMNSAYQWMLNLTNLSAWHSLSLPWNATVKKKKVRLLC